jgi:hypothetical protein
MRLRSTCVAWGVTPRTSSRTYQERDTITGTISVAPNKRNNRDLDIEIEYSVPTGEFAGQGESRSYKMCVAAFVPAFCRDGLAKASGPGLDQLLYPSWSV